MLRRAAFAIAIAGAAAGPLAAQLKPANPSAVAPANRNVRQGFWIGFGFGLGSAGTDCNSCSTSRTNGLSGYLKLGGTISQHVLIGGETNGWTHSESGVDETLAFLTGNVYWYPSATGAFFLKLGLGAMSYKATSGSNDLTATAGAGSFGLGYDFRVGRNMSVTPFLNSLASTSATFKLNGQTQATNESIKLNLVQIGVGLTWH